ncbi:hypothetical protein [Vibrio sp. 99-70-13A1]|uniref:hypothetical protein n=1 Tax=Vibrio sp. 99-70-13A1 TaxID=2607601 RepID=UPI001493BC19|nr:hypothetical protein [Vibrio sp. 99-70-13A1]NOH98437.1 hypothetical protein [Vibrio sp. 99-70-13A1]
MSSVLKNAEESEKALLELISKGMKISQHAVEKRAGLANGALNYKHPKYQVVKDKINRAKLASESNQTAANKELKVLLAKEKNLKDKYRKEKNLLKQRLKKLEGERLELIYQLYHLQQYVAKLEENSISSPNVIQCEHSKWGTTR